jgi:hypothetical protein
MTSSDTWSRAAWKACLAFNLKVETAKAAFPCSRGDAHSEHGAFFVSALGDFGNLMVSGQLRTPRLDVTNEDLIRSHIQAIWLTESGLDLGSTPAHLLQLAGEDLTLLSRSGTASDSSSPHKTQKACQCWLVSESADRVALHSWGVGSWWIWTHRTRHRR